MTTIHNFTAQIFTGPIFSAAAAIALTFALVGGTVSSPAQSPLHTATVSSVYSA